MRLILCGIPGCITVENTVPGAHSRHSRLDDGGTFASVGSNSNFEDKRDLLQLSEEQKQSMRRNLLTTPVFITDEILAWRPVELLKKKSDDMDPDDPTVNVELSHMSIMDYTLDYHKRVIAPTQFVSPFRKKKKKIDSTRSITSDMSIDDISNATGASFTSTDTASTQSSRVNQAEYEGGSLPIQDVDVDRNTILRHNLSDLPYLHEASILYNLAERNKNRIPYTRAGNVLVAVNPLQWINGLYSEEKREIYSNHLVWYPKAKALDSIEPHVYEVSSLAYRGMVIDGNNQSVIVSGETGAGKTVSVKILMSHLATFGSKKIVAPVEEKKTENEDKSKSFFSYRPRFFRNKTEGHLVIEIPEKDEYDDDSLLDILFNNEEKEIVVENPEPEKKLNLIVQRVLDADILLEAFGNAKTQRNDNSSRFSKYTRLQFHVEFRGQAIPSCTLAGSFCNTYLLQKSRVTTHDRKNGERSFHIFYQLLAAPEETKLQFWDELQRKDSSSFKYIGVPSTNTIEGMTDAARWNDTCAAFEIFGIVGERFNTLMRALCATLQLGNITFGTNPSNDEGAIIKSSGALEKCSDILGISVEDLTRAFTKKLVVAPDQSFLVPLSVASARDNCNAFAKAIYTISFAWLVRMINETTRAEDNYMGGSLDKDKFSTIGLLDIFGFETFPRNLFEQMCINHANEKLQHKFIEDVFYSVQQEYKAEGISLDEIKYEDNSDVLVLVEGRLGLIDMLNEECFRPTGSDRTFVNKIYLNSRGKDTPLYKRRHFQAHEFGIKHFAGKVKYDATNFVTKNMDDLSPQVIEIAKQSSNSFIKSEFTKMLTKKRSVKTETVWKKFNLQFNSLLQDIKKTDTRYIRCIVPNKEKVPSETDLKYTLNQLRSAGVMSAVTVSRAAFPNRMNIETALDRFSILVKNKASVRRKPMKRSKSTEEITNGVETIFRKALKSLEKVGDDGEMKKAYICGKTKVYFRSGALEYLEEERLLAFEKMAIVIQCWFRCKLARTYLEVLRIRAESAKVSKKKMRYSPKSLFGKLKIMKSFRRKKRHSV